MDLFVEKWLDGISRRNVDLQGKESKTIGKIGNS